MFRTVNWYAPLDQLRREMEHAFNSALAGVDEPGCRAYPALNLWSAGDAVVVEAEVPGIRKDELEILAVGDELTIKGRRTAFEGDNVTYHRQERGVGEFARVVRLPVEVDAEKIEATLQDGVLTIRLPKAPSARPRQIAVKAG